MSKILFVMKYPLCDAYSVKGKFDGQMKAAEALGHEVYFVAYDHQFTYLIHNGQKTKIKKIWFGYSKHYIHTKAFLDLFDSVCRVMRRMKFDLVYMRDCPLSALGYVMCTKFRPSGAKFVVEIPTYPPEKEPQPTWLRRMYMRYSHFWWHFVEKKVNLFVLIGETANEYHGIPAINIDNGINVDQIPLRTPKETSKIHMLAVAAMSNWQGYDRLIKGIAALNDEMKESVILDMVGSEGDGSLAKWADLARELGLETQVVLHGYKKGVELEPYFNCAALGVGSLGLYRKNFTGASALKLREYCARGLPFVYAGDDPALPGKLPFCLQIPNDDSVVDVAAVLEFAKRSHDAAEIRAYARENMTWEAQLRKVFNALGI